MKIASICHKYPPHVRGGLGRYMERMTQRLAQAGHETMLITMNYPGEHQPVTHHAHQIIIRPTIPRWFRQQLSTDKHMPKLLMYFWLAMHFLWFNLQAYGTVRKLYRTQGVDIIAIHDWMNSIVGILCAITLPIPVVFHIHTTEFTMTQEGKQTDRLKLIYFAERMLGKVSRRVIVPSYEMRALLIQNGWDERKIHVVHHGYEDDGYQWFQSLPDQERDQRITQLRTELNIPQDHNILLFVGRLCAVKGIYALIEAMPQVLAESPNTHLVIVGTGMLGTSNWGEEDNQHVRTLIHDLGLESRIHASYTFLDFRDVLLHYALADICIFPSSYEPFGLVALEAMALGKPVILGNGFPAVLSGTDEESTACRLTHVNARSLAAAIIQLLHTPQQAQTMGNRADQMVHQHFRWDITVQRTTAIYQSCCRQLPQEEYANEAAQK